MNFTDKILKKSAVRNITFKWILKFKSPFKIIIIIIIIIRNRTIGVLSFLVQCHGKF